MTSPDPSAAIAVSHASAWFGLAGVVVGAVITIAREAISSYLRRESDARYLAIRVVCQLEKFVDQCGFVAWDDGTEQGRPSGENGAYMPTSTEPSYKVDAIDGNWKSVPQDLMYEALGFGVKIEAAYRSISAASDDDFDNSGWIEERRYQFCVVGLEAAALAQRFRSRYQIPAFKSNFQSPVVQMQEILKELQLGRAERRRANEVSLALGDSPLANRLADSA